MPRKKPDPAGVQVFGDSAIDAATARNAGVAVWLLPHGYDRGRPVAQARPDRFVAGFGALRDALDARALVSSMGSS